MRESPRILLVEEEPVLADLTAFRLELLGYSVRAVHSGEEALTAIEGELPDVIILDLFLPGIDGLELTNRLSNDERTAGVPIMVFSADGDLLKVQRAFTAGAKDYLLTPFDPAVLEQKLERLVALALS